MMPGFSQLTPANVANQHAVNPVDLIGIIGNMGHKKGPPRSDSLIISQRNTSLLPIIGYGPANGFVIGAAVGITNLLGEADVLRQLNYTITPPEK